MNIEKMLNKLYQLDNSVVLSQEDSLVLKKQKLSIDKIKEYKARQKQKKFIFRPQILNEYIGQDKAKKIIETTVKKIKQLRPVHILIDGLKGHGKTTLAYIINNMLEGNFYQIIASNVNIDKLIEILNWINQSDKLPVLFIDEIHGLDDEIVEIFYPIMEDYQIEGKNIKPFVLIGATTEKNILVKKFAPFVDRFQTQITLERYTTEDILKILKQYYRKLYKNYYVNETILLQIAKNCKFIPRIAIALLEDYIITQDINKVLNMHDIVKEGLTGKDIKILKVLSSSNRPIGEEALATMVGTSRADYKTIYEPYLIEMGYMARGRTGRFITDKGLKLLETLNKEV